MRRRRSRHECRPMPGTRAPCARACDRCLARSWLIARLSGHLDHARGRIADGARARRRGSARRRRRASSAALVRRSCALRRRRAHAAQAAARRNRADLPLRAASIRARLRALESPPAVLHVAGGLDRFLRLVADEPVAIVGARRATMYGVEIARVARQRPRRGGSGRASAGWRSGSTRPRTGGRSDIAAPTVAVLPGGADRAYPPASERSTRGFARPARPSPSSRRARRCADGCSRRATGSSPPWRR